ncbi:MAG: xylulokinase [Candidatus Brocadiia bacterium]
MPGTSITIGVDLGTTGCRVRAVTDEAESVAEAKVSYKIERPEPGFAEIDPAIWWKAFRQTTHKIMDEVSARSVKAIAVGSQSTPLLPVDRSNNPIRKAIIWQDTRSLKQTREITEQFGRQEVRKVTGWPPSTFLVWPKINWFFQNEPRVSRKTRWFLTANGFINERLCGDISADHSNMIGYPRDAKSLEWDRDMCRWKEFPVEKIPRVVPPTRVIGKVSRRAAQLCGLPPDLPVVAGGLDTACAALATGAVVPGCAFEVSGTSGGIGMISEKPSNAFELGVSLHVVESAFINHAPMSAGGASLVWCKNTLCQSELQEAQDSDVSVYDLIQREVLSLPEGPSGLLFLPYMAGERAPVWDDETRGAMVGLTLETTRPEIIKTVMEGTAYAIAQNVRIAERAGLEVEELRSCGGGSQSIVWSQLKADIAGKPIAVFPKERDAAFGAALLAHIGATDLDMLELADQLDKAEPAIYIPRDEITEMYEPYQLAYEELYPNMSHVLPAPKGDLDIDMDLGDLEL